MMMESRFPKSFVSTWTVQAQDHPKLAGTRFLNHRKEILSIQVCADARSGRLQKNTKEKEEEKKGKERKERKERTL